MTVDLHRVRRTTASHPRTPPDHRHLLHAPQLEKGWTVRLTPTHSYALEKNTSTGSGVIQLDGVLVAVNHSQRRARIRIFWLMPTDLKHARFRSTPVTGVDYEIRFDDVDGLAGHPPTIWDPRTIETMKDSARRGARQHQQKEDRPPTHWSELGEL